MAVLGKTKKEVVSEFRSGEILEAARLVFAAKGYGDATVDDIADKAGIAKGTVYLYFPSKREIFVELIRKGFLDLHSRTVKNMDAAETTADKLRAFISTRMDFSDSSREFFQLYYSEYSNLLATPSKLSPEFQDLYDQQAKLMEETLARGVRRGEVKKMNTAAIARLVYDTTRGAIAQRILGWSRRDAKEDADLVFEVLWRGIGCE